MKPNRPGWYWWRMGTHHAWLIVRVHLQLDGILYACRVKPYFNNDMWVSKVLGEWGGEALPQGARVKLEGLAHSLSNVSKSQIAAQLQGILKDETN